MGLEAKCRVSCEGAESVGNAHCGDGEIDFRGDFRFRWKWADLSEVEDDHGVLVVTSKGKRAEFHLGDKAAKWCHSIRNPKSRLDKLGVKPGLKYMAVGEFDDAFSGELLDRAGKPSRKELDVVFVRLNQVKDLPKLLKARSQIVQNGMVWAVWPKGRKEFREGDVRSYAKENGLVDVKVASFSDVLSALKLVIPVKMRKT